MIHLFISSFLASIFHFIAGKFLSNHFNLDNRSFYSLSLTSIIGLIFLSFISLTLNFFIPLSYTVNTIIFIAIILLFLIFIKFFLKKSEIRFLFKYILFCTIGTFSLLIFSKVYTPDAGLYHLPFVNIINENKIIIGLSNIHQRFGHTSIMQYLSAIHFNNVFGLNGILIPLSSIGIYSIIFFLDQIKNIEKISISKIFSILIIFYICWKMNRYSEYGNDAPAHFIYFIIIQLYLNFLEKSSKIDETNFFTLSFLSLFAFLNKTTLVLSILIPMICLNHINLKNLINFKYLFLIIFFFSWIFKNILITGCLIYPIPITCLDLLWTNLDKVSNVYDVSIGTEAWSKDWVNQKGVVLNYENFLKNFYWLKFWLNNHFQKILTIIMPYILIIIFFIIFLKFFKKKKIEVKKINLKIYIPIFLIITLSVFIWFIKFPVYRFGYSYIVSFFALSFSIYIYYIHKNNYFFNLKKICRGIICIAIIVLTSKQLVRISKNINSKYESVPWPYYNYLKKEYRETNVKEFSKNGVFFYYLPKNAYCYYSKSPCTSVEVDSNLNKKINSLKYKIFYFSR